MGITIFSLRIPSVELFLFQSVRSLGVNAGKAFVHQPKFPWRRLFTASLVKNVLPSLLLRICVTGTRGQLPVILNLLSHEGQFCCRQPFTLAATPPHTFQHLHLIPRGPRPSRATLRLRDGNKPGHGGSEEVQADDAGGWAWLGYINIQAPD